MVGMANGRDTNAEFEKAVATVKAEVIEQVMVELRPLLTQLAELARAKSPDPKMNMATAEELHAQAKARMDAMGKRLSERVAMRQGQIKQRMQRKK